MTGEEFGIIFWNIWSDGQLTVPRLSALRGRLDELIERQRPDVLGLNEVVLDRRTGSSSIVEHLREHGYTVHFSPHGPDDHHVLVGSVLASRREPVRIAEPVLGPDETAAIRGFPGHAVTAIDADVPLRGPGHVRVVVNYWAHLVPYNWRSHGEHARSLKRHLTGAVDHGRTIIGGDFNELKHMAAMRDLARTYHRATGSFRQPTWRLGGKRRFLLQANYDHILWTRNGKLALREFKVLGRKPSDHAPLYARFLTS